VISPNHKDSGITSSWRSEAPFISPAAWSDETYRNRARDIESILSAMKKDPKWSSAIDWSRVALAGHSLGGYTVLGLAGAWPSWKMTGIKAILALSPFCTPLVEK